MSGCFLTSLEVINQSCQRWKKTNVRSCSKGHQPFPYSLRAVLIQDSSTAFKVFLFSQSFEAPDAFFFFFLFLRVALYPALAQIARVSSGFREKWGCSAQLQSWPWAISSQATSKTQTPSWNTSGAESGLNFYRGKGQIIRKQSCCCAL